MAMTNALVAPSPQIPQPPGIAPNPGVTIPMGVARSKMMAKDRRRAQKAIERGFDRWGDEFWHKQQVMAKAMGWRPQGDRMKRLAAYLQRPQESWDEAKVKFPSDWQEDYSDYQELRAAAERGEFNDKGGS